MDQNLTYTQCGDYYIPDIRLVNVETQILGKYGRMLPAVGFSIKLDALAEVAQAPEETKALVIRFHPNARVEALRAAARYRKEHRKIRLMPDQHALAISVEEE